MCIIRRHTRNVSDKKGHRLLLPHFVCSYSICSSPSHWHTRKVSDKNGYFCLNVLVRFDNSRQMAAAKNNPRTSWIGFFQRIKDNSTAKSNLECMKRKCRRLLLPHFLFSYRSSHPFEFLRSPSSQHRTPMDPDF